MPKYLALNDKHFGILRFLYVEWFGPERGHCHHDGNIANAPWQHCHEQMIRAITYMPVLMHFTIGTGITAGMVFEFLNAL